MNPIRHPASPFVPGPVCPTLHALTSYYDQGVIRRVWAWPGQLEETYPMEPPSATVSQLDWMLSQALDEADGRRAA